MSQFRVSWLSPPSDFELPSEEVHASRIPLDGDEPDYTVLSIPTVYTQLSS